MKKRQPENMDSFDKESFRIEFEKLIPQLVTEIGDLLEKPTPRLTRRKRQEMSNDMAWGILNIADNEERRLVQSGEQLLDVVIELRRLEEKLHGETPAAVDLWNEVKPGVYRPVTENDLSNYVKRHFDYDLRERGIIANREVQRRRAESHLGVACPIKAEMNRISLLSECHAHCSRWFDFEFRQERWHRSV